MVNRYNDILELLNYVDELIINIEAAINNSVLDTSQHEIVKPKIKSVLEHLRSCLEYSACDIYEIIINPKHKNLPRNLYFPYGTTLNNFNKSIENNFRNLKKLNNNIYTLIENIQPFKCNDNWLPELCKYSNKNKHDRMLKQKREDAINLKIANINLFRMPKGFQGTVTMTNSVINNQRIEYLSYHNDNLYVKNNNPHIDCELIPTTDFKFEITNKNILSFLKTSYTNVKDFTSELYKLM